MCFSVVTIVWVCTCDVTMSSAVYVMPIVQCATAESANPSVPIQWRKSDSICGGGAQGIT